MRKHLVILFACLFSISLFAQQNVKLKKKDRKRDVEFITTEGTIIARLYDSTPLHRDNFLRLVKSRFYDSILFHRVIKNFMIQAGDPNSKRPLQGNLWEMEVQAIPFLLSLGRHYFTEKEW